MDIDFDSKDATKQPEAQRPDSTGPLSSRWGRAISHEKCLEGPHANLDSGSSPMLTREGTVYIITYSDSGLKRRSLAHEIGKVPTETLREPDGNYDRLSSLS